MRPRTRLQLRTLLRRAFLYLLLPSLSILALRLAWGWEASYRLAAAQKKFATIAIPVPPTSDLPADRAAVAALIQAADTVQALPPEARALINGDNLTTSFADITWTDQEAHDLDLVLAQNASLLRLIDEAESRPDASWPSLFPSQPNPPLMAGTLRQLANFTYVAALRDHAHGHDDLALTNIQRTLNLARIIDHDHSLISHLIAMFIQTLAVNGIERFEPDFKWTDPRVKLMARGLIAVFCDEEALQHALILCIQQDYLVTQAFYHQYAKGLNNWWLRPHLDDQTRRDLAITTLYLPAFHASNWPAAKSLIPPSPAPHMELHLNEMLFLDVSMIDRVVLLHMQRRTDGYAAACLLAARLYAVEHGRLPADSRELAAIIRKIPSDPLELSDAPLHYRLDPAGPTVWSVGEDGKDDGGITAPGTTRRWFGSSPDAVYGAAWRAVKIPASLPASLPASAPGGNP